MAPDRARHPTLPVLAVIALGGALGAVARYAVGVLVPGRSAGVPWDTLAVNASGCLLIGVLMVLLTEVLHRPHPWLRPFLGTGVLGGYTTFSTYAAEVLTLGDRGALAVAFAYLLGTVVVAVLAAHAGIRLTRALVARPGRRTEHP